jgi:hypothetical protein
MGFMFRVEQITVIEENTVLTGHMISGALDWRQQVEIQIEEDMRTVFAASLRGVASAEDTGLTLFDPSLWEKVLALPLSIGREKRIDLVLDGIPSRNLPVPAIAVGVDAAMSISADRLETAFPEINALYFATHKMERPRVWDQRLPVGRYWRSALVVFFNYGLDTGTVW